MTLRSNHRSHDRAAVRRPRRRLLRFGALRVALALALPIVAACGGGPSSAVPGDAAAARSAPTEAAPADTSPPDPAPVDDADGAMRHVVDRSSDVSGADASGADVSGADVSGADASEADADHGSDREETDGTDVDGTSSGGSHAHAHEPMSAEAPLPGASLYHLDAEWTDHRGRPLRLAELRGHPVIVTMIYASCETACPILIRDATRIDEALPPDVREDTRVLVVSFDPERDAPDRLAAYVASSDLGDPRWSFAVGEPHATRALAALLGVRYRPVGDGMFSHSNLITVLGPDGVARQRSEGLGQPVEPVVAAVVTAYEETQAR